MAARTPPPLEPDLIYPDAEDWAQADDGTVFDSARAGIPQALAELARRGMAPPPPTNAGLLQDALNTSFAEVRE